jgi:hypothetical protein
MLKDNVIVDNEMARPKGSLNRRTRAALLAAKEGNFDGKGDSVIGYLLKLACDPGQAVATRIQAAKTALPYLKPALSAVEQTVIEPAATKSEADINAELLAFIEKADPEPRERLRLALSGNAVTH